MSLVHCKNMQFNFTFTVKNLFRKSGKICFERMVCGVQTFHLIIDQFIAVATMAHYTSPLFITISFD